MMIVGSRDLEVRSLTNQVNLAIFFSLSPGPWVLSCVWLTSSKKLIFHISLFITCSSGECFSGPSSSKSAIWSEGAELQKKINKHGEKKESVLWRRRRKERKQGEVHILLKYSSLSLKKEKMKKEPKGQKLALITELPF